MRQLVFAILLSMSSVCAASLDNIQQQVLDSSEMLETCESAMTYYQGMLQRYEAIPEAHRTEAERSKIEFLRTELNSWKAYCSYRKREY